MLIARVDSDRHGLEIVTRKVASRLLPLLIPCYFTAYLDRVNLGFAASAMNEDLGFSPLVYGWGSGIFFLGYALLEAPSNYVLHQLGARLWISRIMVSWGLISSAMALISGEMSFYVMRFLLGVAEAGFAPGLVLYLTYWFPPDQRARILSQLLFALPVSTILGAPISGLVLAYMDGCLGLRGWQWLFVIEGLPSIALGYFVFRLLPDRPEQARWLSSSERRHLSVALESAAPAPGSQADDSVWPALREPRTLALGVAYFGLLLALYALNMWLPQIVSGWGLSPLTAGFTTSAPYIFGAVAMLLWSRRADRLGAPRRHAMVAAGAAAVGLVAASILTGPVPSILALSLAASGTLAMLPTFWAFATATVRGTRAALMIAIVNSIGSLAGFCGPYLVGWIKNATGDYSSAMALLAMGPILSILVMMNLGAERGVPAAREG